MTFGCTLLDGSRPWGYDEPPSTGARAGEEAAAPRLLAGEVHLYVLYRQGSAVVSPPSAAHTASQPPVDHWFSVPAGNKLNAAENGSVCLVSNILLRPFV